MKVRIVFARGLVDTSQLNFIAVVGDDGEPIDTFDGCWIADGDVEALCLDVLPPLDKVTLTVQPTSDKPLPEPLYSAGDSEHWSPGKWPVKIRSVETDHGNGRFGITLGGPVAWTDTKEQAETLAGILNEWEARKSNG